MNIDDATMFYDLLIGGARNQIFLMDNVVHV